MLQLNAAESLLQCHLENENLLLSAENRLWTVQYSKLGGRGVFAKRDIKRGEVIFVDKPLLRGPRTYNKYLPMCVNCYKSNSTLFPCDNGCGLPVCSDQCENSSTHTNRECKYLQQLQPTCGTMWSKDLLKAVILIRSLTLAQYQKDIIGVLQCHNGPRHGCDEIDLLEKNVSNKIDSNDKEFMLRLCRVLDTNAFETAVVVDNSTSTSLRALYPLGAFLNHCCVPNVRHYFNKSGLMIAKAAVEIAEGDEITMTYTDFLWHTSLRWKYLKMTKNFECSCRRCSDPMELDSKISALYCNNGKCTGYIFPDNPIYSETSWTCCECMNKVPLTQVNTKRSEVKDIVSTVLSNSPKTILRFIENKLKALVPETNYITLDLKFRVVSFFGRTDDLQWKDLTDEELQFKAKYCNDLISILDQVNPGDCQKKGLILYELYCTNKEQHLRKMSDRQDEHIEHYMRKENTDNLGNIIKEVINVLSDDIAAPDDISTLVSKEDFGI